MRMLAMHQVWSAGGQWSQMGTNGWGFGVVPFFLVDNCLSLWYAMLNFFVVM